MKKSSFYCSEFDWKRKACICPTTAFMRHPILWYGTSERGNVVKFVKDWWGGWKNWQRWGNFLQQKEIEKKSNLIGRDFSICHTCHPSGRSFNKSEKSFLVVSGSSIYLKNWKFRLKNKICSRQYFLFARGTESFSISLIILNFKLHSRHGYISKIVFFFSCSISWNLI